MDNDNENEDKYKELFRRVEVTCKSRYNASSRLQWQHILSQWTIALLSLALIAIPVLTLGDLNLRFSEQYINVMQVILAVLVLIYSLLIGTENYSRRSEKLHRCGLELGRLARQIKPYKEGELNRDGKYQDLQNKYYDTLEKYENHTKIDFLFSKLDLSKTYYASRHSYYFGHFVAWLRYTSCFFGHFLVIGLVIAWTAFMIIPAP